MMQVKCPCCERLWPEGCEQAISIDLFNECVVCKFTPSGKGSNDGTQEELDIVSEKASKFNLDGLVFNPNPTPTAGNIQFNNGDGKKVIEFCSDGKLMWNDREVETDEELKKAVIEIRDILVNKG